MDTNSQRDLITSNLIYDPSTQNQTSPVVQIRFNACYVRDEKEYVWGMYKTYGGARRSISNRTGMLARMEGWYIERVKSWTDENGKYRASGVIIAMQRDIVVHNRFKVIA